MKTLPILLLACIASNVYALTTAQKEIVYSVSANKFYFAADSVHDRSVDWLERQIRMGELLGRDDVVSSALEKLFAITPQQPTGMAAQARLLFRQNKKEQAQVILTRLTDQFPKNLETQKLQKYFDINGADSNRYKQIKILELGGRTDQALNAYHALFPNNVFPAINIQLDYLNLAGKKDKNWRSVKQQLELLNLNNPHVSVLQMSLAFHLASHDVNSTWTNTILWQLSSDSIVGERVILYLYSDLDDQEVTAKWAEKHTRLASYFPGNGQIKSLNRLAQVRWENEQVLLKDPHYRAKIQGLKLLDSSRYENREKAYKLLKYANSTIKNDPEILTGLGRYYLKIKESNAAVKYFNLARAVDTNVNHQSQYKSLILTAQYWGDLRSGDILSEQGNTEQAHANYFSAYKRNKKNIYAQISLGKLALQEANYLEANKWFTLVLTIQPHQQTALEGMVDIVRLQQGNAKALQYAQSQCSKCQVVLTDSINNLKLETKIEALLDVVKHHKYPEALQITEELAKFKAIPPWTCKTVADQLITISEEKRAFQFIEECRNSDKSEDMQLAYSLFLYQQDQQDAALRVLKTTSEEKRSDRLKKQIETLALDIQFANIIQVSETDLPQSEQLLAKIQNNTGTSDFTLIRVASTWIDLGNNTQALKVLHTLPIQNLSADDLLFAGQLSFRAEDYQYANTLFTDAYQRDLTVPQKLSAAIGLVKANQKLKTITKDHMAIAYLKTHKSLLSFEQRVELVAILYGSEERALADQELQQLSLNNSNNIIAVSALLDLALENEKWTLVDILAKKTLELDKGYDRQDTQLEAASLMSLYKNADDNWLANKAKSVIAQSRAKEQGHIKLGVDYGFRTGAYSDLTIPFEALIPFAKYDGHLLFKADFSAIDSGDSTYFDNEEKLGLTDQGMGFGIGWLTNNWQFDIGISPLGFNKSNILGGIQFTQTLGEFDLTPALSRRVNDDSVLAYSGIDFENEEYAGAVIENKASLGLSWDQGGAVGFWASTQFSKLTGDNVEDNNKIALYGGTYYKWLTEKDKNLNVGFNMFTMRYDKNLGENIFGHGGYYSPQHYLSVSLPVRFSARYNQDLSYSLFASLSHSWSHLDGAYGTNDSGTNSSGFGVSVELTVEKKIAPKWYLGGMYNLSQSDDYEPHRAQLYIKYLFNESWDPVVIQPTPIQLYSDFY